ncbi:sigma factor-like helix-turn-helix DNA-binding protein [Streptomyces albipurpureus]|uniref:RNA polymerase sigma factor 70 region 4 type 2 domain-containing protein n=1 Tax=Streptomyces albipurpureus TaxID=2897419 RepID=A0ABT0ULA2_9ACTN|nr:sigma factor-like helix-turn-helix DNA-binding protein [Streptomyces sp. CWNU-1]MCM2389389.1 hypothetical protein [Streptomyces sp. CWNU-1]
MPAYPPAVRVAREVDASKATEADQTGGAVEADPTGETELAPSNPQIAQEPQHLQAFRVSTVSDESALSASSQPTSTSGTPPVDPTPSPTTSAQPPLAATDPGAAAQMSKPPKSPLGQTAQAPKPSRGKQPHSATRPVPAVKRAARPTPPHPASPAHPVLHPAPPAPAGQHKESTGDTAHTPHTADTADTADTERSDGTERSDDKIAGPPDFDEPSEHQQRPETAREEPSWPQWASRDSLLDAVSGLTPAEAFDGLYTRAAPDLVRQAFLLTGRRQLSHESVERAFHLAWQNWPEVATDRDPVGWVRSAAYEYAMSPWQRLRPAHQDPDTPPLAPERRKLLDALLELPPAYRRTLLLYDGLGLDLPETAAETEASTPATANRVLHARDAIAERLPQLNSPEALHDELIELVRACPTPRPLPAPIVRRNSERHVWFWTRAALTITTLIISVTGLTAATAPTQYQSVVSPGQQIGGVPAHAGPQRLSEHGRELREQLLSDPAHGPGRLVPQTR